MSTNQTPSSLLDILTTSLAPMIWGSTFIVTTQLLPPDRPFTAALIRALPAGLLLVLFSKRLPATGQWGRMVVLAALNIGVFQALLFTAAYRLPGGLAAVVGAIQPLLVMGLAWALDRRRPTHIALGAGVLGGAGMAALLVSSRTVWDPVGISAALAGAASMACGTFLARRWQTGLPVLASTGWQLLLGGLMLIPVALIVDLPLPTLTTKQMLAYGYLSMAGALLAYALWFRGISRLPPVAVSSLGLLSPLVAVVLGWVILGQTVTDMSLVGLIVVLGSVLAAQWAANSRPVPIR